MSVTNLKHIQKRGSKGTEGEREVMEGKEHEVLGEI